MQVRTVSVDVNNELWYYAGTARKLVFRLNLEEERKYRRYLMHTLPFATDCLRYACQHSRASPI